MKARGDKKGWVRVEWKFSTGRLVPGEGGGGKLMNNSEERSFFTFSLGRVLSSYQISFSRTLELFSLW